MARDTPRDREGKKRERREMREKENGGLDNRRQSIPGRFLCRELRSPSVVRAHGTSMPPRPRRAPAISRESRARRGCTLLAGPLAARPSRNSTEADAPDVARAAGDSTRRWERIPRWAGLRSCPSGVRFQKSNPTLTSRVYFYGMHGDVNARTRISTNGDL